MFKKTKKQPLIANFFTQGGASSKSSDRASIKTPEKSKTLLKTASFLAKSESRSAFDEPPSSDISIESPEIKNFRNPSLQRTFSSNAEVVDLTEDPDSSPTKKRRFESNSQEVRLSCSIKESSQNILFVNDSTTSSASTTRLRDTWNPRKLHKTSSNMGANIEYTSSGNIRLSREQIKVIEAVVHSELNVFYTGSAGTGKSIILKELVTRLKNKYAPSKVGVTASTGLAACNIGGQTLHRYLGIGRGEGNAEALANRIKKNREAARRWQTVQVLIIDEISMVDGSLFEKLNSVGKIIRKSAKPFGGIQIVCTGDFFQLPPVNKTNGVPNFCFKSKAWAETIQKTVLLKEIFRQKGDNELIDLLNSLRSGDVVASMNTFTKLTRKVIYEDGIEPTELYPTRNEVKLANDLRLQRLEGETITYHCKDSTKNPNSVALLDSLMCEKKLDLKVGAQVMYLRNLDDEIVNGSIGTVLYFLTPTLWEKIIQQYTDVHDDQAIEEIRMIASRTGACWDDKDMRMLEKIPYERRSRVVDLCKTAALDPKSEVYPVVRFKLANGDFRNLLVQREDFNIEVGHQGGLVAGDNVLSRSQVPLLLSWALSIHKAQGQTIQRLRVDLSKIFEIGQVYVALSRATSKDSLEIVNFSPEKIRVASVVKEFYSQLE